MDIYTWDDLHINTQQKSTSCQLSVNKTLDLQLQINHQIYLHNLTFCFANFVCVCVFAFTFSFKITKFDLVWPNSSHRIKKVQSKL